MDIRSAWQVYLLLAGPKCSLAKLDLLNCSDSFLIKLDRQKLRHGEEKEKKNMLIPAPEIFSVRVLGVKETPMDRPSPSRCSVSCRQITRRARRLAKSNNGKVCAERLGA